MWTTSSSAVHARRRRGQCGHQTTPMTTCFQSPVVADLVGGYLPLYDGAYTFIADTTQQITQLSYPDGTTAYNVLADLMALEGNVYWAAWETVETTGLWRFEFSSGRTKSSSSAVSTTDSTARDQLPTSSTDFGALDGCVGRKRTTVRHQHGGCAHRRGPDPHRRDLTRHRGRDGRSGHGRRCRRSSTSPSASQPERPADDRPAGARRRRGMLVDPWEVRPGGAWSGCAGVDPAPSPVATGRDGARLLFRIVATSLPVVSDGSVSSSSTPTR
jgi:hypothetical protein